MTINVRFSQHTTVDGKKYLGGPLISGTAGIYSPTMTSTNAVFDEVLKQENIDGTKDYRCFYFQNNFTGQAVYEPKIEFVSMTNTATFRLGLASDKNLVASTISTENTAPGGIVFNTVTAGAAVDLIQGASKVLGPDEFVYFWLERTPNNLGASGTITGEFVFQTRYRT